VGARDKRGYTGESGKSEDGRGLWAVFRGGLEVVEDESESSGIENAFLMKVRCLDSPCACAKHELRVW
jgi:hypothetical protein